MPRHRSKARPKYRSFCPISSSLDLVGDRWTLLVVRDMLFAGARRYGDFLRSWEAIPTNLLADRLKRLEKAGIIRKTPYQRRPVRYEYRLTARGADLLPVLLELSRWSTRYIPGRFRPGPEASANAAKAVAEARGRGLSKRADQLPRGG